MRVGLPPGRQAIRSELHRPTQEEEMLRTALILVIVLMAVHPSQGNAGVGDLVKNGDFSGGSAEFDSQYGTGLCTTAWTYRILANPHDCHSLWEGSDHTTGTGNLMAVNGANVTNNSIVWTETISVAPGTQYLLALYVCSLHIKNPATLSIRINDQEVGTIAAPATQLEWTAFSKTWDSLLSTKAVITIVDLVAVPDGNDFGLDDISFIGEVVVPTLSQSWGRLKAHYR